MTEQNNQKQVRIKQGRVISNKMDKTIVVLLTWRVEHPVYGKVIPKSTKLHVHDPENQCKIGDLVSIRETKPFSKTKAWALVEILEKAS